MPISRKRWPECPIERCMVTLTGRWKPRVLWQLREGPRRYTDLRGAVPKLTDRMLTQTLAELVEDGVIERSAEQWSLSPAGAALKPALEAMWDWGTKRPERVADSERRMG